MCKQKWHPRADGRSVAGEAGTKARSSECQASVSALPPAASFSDYIFSLFLSTLSPPVLIPGLVLLIRSIDPQPPGPSLFTKTPGTIKKLAGENVPHM